VTGSSDWRKKNKKYLKEIIVEDMKWLRIESKVHNDELSLFSNVEAVD
jgi:hypothetical protein